MSEEDEIAGFLREHGLPLANLHPAESMPSFTRWSGNLFSDVGDATIDIFSHPLKAKPGSIVEYEERLEAMKADRAHELLAHGRTPSLGLVVACSADAAPIFDTLRELASGSAPRIDLAYHPQLDRILGGDMFRQFQHLWTKASLMSLHRATRIRDLVVALNESMGVEEGTSSPFPLPLAIIQVNAYPIVVDDEVVQLDVDELFAYASLRRAPAEYRQLVQLVSVVSTPHRIAGKRPLSEDELATFVSTLFGWLHVAHAQRYSFSLEGVSCAVPDFIAVDGSATDAYYIAQDDPDFDSLRCLDVGNAMATTIAASSEVASRSPEVFAAAVRVYAGPRPPRRMESLAREIDARLIAGADLQRDPAFHVLVDSMAAHAI